MSPQPPDWTQFAAGLPENLPDQAYDALREKYFSEHVAPEVMKQGYGLDSAKKQWMQKTVRPGRSSSPRSDVVGSEAAQEMAAPFMSGEPQLQKAMSHQSEDAALEAQRQGIEPAPYQMAGSMLGQLPFWAAGMGEAGAIAKGMQAGPLLEKAIKTAAGGIIQGSYDLVKTRSTIEGLKGAAFGAGMVGAFEAAGPLKKFLLRSGLDEEAANSVAQVAKGTASEGEWQAAIDASLRHEKLDGSISQWVGEQVQAAKQAGVAKDLFNEPLGKQLKVQMMGADGKPYNLGGAAGMKLDDIEKIISRIGDHLNAGGSIEQISGTPKAVSQFYHMLSMSNPESFDLELPLRGVSKEVPQAPVTVPSVNDEAIKLPKVETVVGKNPPSAEFQERLRATLNSDRGATLIDSSINLQGPETARILEAGKLKGYVFKQSPDGVLAWGHPVMAERLANAQTAKAGVDLNQLINARNSVYHATDLDGFRGILDSGEIQVSSQSEESGVSVSRVPRLASKPDKAITFVIDSEKMPNSRPYVEGSFGKTSPGIPENSNLYNDYLKVASEFGHSSPEGREAFSKWTDAVSESPTVPNQHFEFENRTYNEPIPLSAVKGIVVDKAALRDYPPDGGVEPSGWDVFDTVTGKTLGRADSKEEALRVATTWEKAGKHVDYEPDYTSEFIDELRQLAQEKGLSLKVMDSGKEVHSYRAKLSQQPPEMRWATPLYDQLEELPSGQVYNRLTGENYNSVDEALTGGGRQISMSAQDVSYKETPLAHRFSGEIPDEVMPGSAQAVTIPAGEGEKSSIFYREPSKELIFHENLHGHYSYLGIDDWLNTEHNDPIVQEIFHGAFPDDAKALYNQHGALPEEVFTYAASAVRVGNEDLLERFGEADTSKEHVLDWTANTARSILDKAAEKSDSLHKRTLERRLNSVIIRATGKFDDMDRVFANSPAKLDMERGGYSVHEGETTHYFNDRATALEHLEDIYQEPLQSPELVPTQGIPDGVPRYALKVPAPTNEPPLTSSPTSPELTPLPLKAGTSAFSFFFRPFYDWLGDVSAKFDRPDLFSTFKQIDDKLIDYNNAIRPHTKTLLSTLGENRERMPDFLKWLQASELDRPFVERELHFKPEELKAVQRYESEFLSEFPGLDDYLKQDLERLRNANYDPKEVWPHGKKEGLAAELTTSGRLDPRDTNLMRLSSIWMRSSLHGEIIEPTLQQADELVNAKLPGGKEQLGQLAPLLRRHLAYVRGTPDVTARAIQGALEATIDSINQGVEKVNAHLPENLQIPSIDSPAQDLLQKYIMLTYAGSLAGRPGVLVRAALQTFVTGFPLMGNYLWKGIARSFEAARESTESDAWKIAEKYGAFVEKANIQELIAGGGDLGWESTLADKALRMIQWSHNSSRLVSFWGHAEKALDALREHGADADAFSRASDLWYMPEGMRAKYLQELPHIGADQYEDFSRRIASDLTGLTQWNYRKGANPGLYKWQLGRLFGQYGTWPLNYIEYARRYAFASDKTASMQALSRLVVAHGAILAAGASAGIDTRDWVFAQPMAWGGGPLLQATVGLPAAIGDWHSEKGAEARQEILGLINPLNLVPGAEEAHQVWKAVSDNDPNLWVRLLGFKPLKD